MLYTARLAEKLCILLNSQVPARRVLWVYYPRIFMMEWCC